MKPQDYWKNFLAFWNSLGKNERVGFAGGAAGISLLVVFLAFWVFAGNYSVLFSDLDPRDAATITEELRRMKVPYKLEDAGTKVLVDEKSVHETRIRLMAHGASLNGGVGFEIFDNKEAGMSEYAQKINYQRALQGELARTIMSVEQVKHARVHLVVSEAGLFRRDKTKPKASVSLILKTGARLSGEQITGIQRLVAAAVPNLEPTMVTVLDQRGVTLSPIVEADEEIAAVSGKLKLKKTTEEYLARKIAEVMDRTFGPGQAIVSVDATLNFDEVRRTQQSIVPLRAGNAEEAGAVVRKRQSTYRTSKSGATKAVDGDAEYTASASPMTSTTEVEYELSKTVDQIVSAPGGIRRLSVGVIVPAQLGESQVEKIRGIVRMVVGLNEERGDAISVQPIDQLMLKGNSAAMSPGAEIADENNAGASFSVVLRKIGAYVVDHPLAIAIGALSVLLIVVGGWLMARRSENQPTVLPTSATLTDEQRRQLLADIQAWIEAEKASTGGAKA